MAFWIVAISPASSSDISMALSSVENSSLESHYQLGQVKGVRVQVVDERRGGNHTLFIDVQLIDDDRLYSLINGCHDIIPSSFGPCPNPSFNMMFLRASRNLG